MQTIQVGQLKSDFSSVLENIKNYGEEYVVEYGRNHKKVAMLVPYKEPTKKRNIGLLKGQATIADDFDEESDEINSTFYGEDA